MASPANSNNGRVLLPRERILVAILEEEGYDLECSSDYGLGAEAQLFAMPPYLGTDCRPAAERLARRLQALDGPIGLHGPFMDLTHCSPDPAVRALSRERYLEAFDLAGILSAEYVVFHSQYNVQLRFPEYPDLFHALSMEFWPEVVNEAEKRGTDIYVENMFDADPAPIRRLVDAIGSTRFQVCFDVAHAIIYSDLNLSHWIEVLGQHVKHIHINDCDGVNDLHLALGEGTTNVARAIELIESTGLHPTYTLETNRGGRASAEYLGLRPLART